VEERIPTEAAPGVGYWRENALCAYPSSATDLGTDPWM